MNSTTHTLIAENAARASLKAKSAEEREKAIRAILTHDLPSVVQVAFEAEGITTDLMMEGLAVRGSSHGDGCCSSIIAQALVSQAALRTDAAMVLRRAVQLRPDIAHDLMVGCVTHLRTVAMGNRKAFLDRVGQFICFCLLSRSCTHPSLLINEFSSSLVHMTELIPAFILMASMVFLLSSSSHRAISLIPDIMSLSELVGSTPQTNDVLGSLAASLVCFYAKTQGEACHAITLKAVLRLMRLGAQVPDLSYLAPFLLRRSHNLQEKDIIRLIINEGLGQSMMVQATASLIKPLFLADLAYRGEKEVVWAHYLLQRLPVDHSLANGSNKVESQMFSSHLTRHRTQKRIVSRLWSHDDDKPLAGWLKSLKEELDAVATSQKMKGQSRSILDIGLEPSREIPALSPSLSSRQPPLDIETIAAPLMAALQHPSIKVQSSAVEALVGAVSSSPFLAISLLPLMMALLKKGKPEAQLAILNILPAMSLESSVHSFANRVLLPMQQSGQHILTCLSLKLIVDSWMISGKSWGRVEAAINGYWPQDTSAAAPLLLRISRAHLIRRIVSFRAEKGLEFVNAIHDAIKDPSDEVAALGLDSLALMCQADLLDFFLAFKVVNQIHPTIPSKPLSAAAWIKLLGCSSLDAMANTEKARSAIDALLAATRHPLPQVRAEAFKGLSLFSMDKIGSLRAEDADEDDPSLMPPLELGPFIQAFATSDSPESDVDARLAAEELAGNAVGYEYENRRSYVLQASKQAVPISSGNHGVATHQAAGTTLRTAAAVIRRLRFNLPPLLLSSPSCPASLSLFINPASLGQKSQSKLLDHRRSTMMTSLQSFNWSQFTNPTIALDAWSAFFTIGAPDIEIKDALDLIIDLVMAQPSPALLHSAPLAVAAISSVASQPIVDKCFDWILRELNQAKIDPSPSIRARGLCSLCFSLGRIASRLHPTDRENRLKTITLLDSIARGCEFGDVREAAVEALARFITSAPPSQRYGLQAFLSVLFSLLAGLSMSSSFGWLAEAVSCLVTSAPQLLTSLLEAAVNDPLVMSDAMALELVSGTLSALCYILSQNQDLESMSLSLSRFAVDNLIDPSSGASTPLLVQVLSKLDAHNNLVLFTRLFQEGSSDRVKGECAKAIGLALSSNASLSAIDLLVSSVKSASLSIHIQLRAVEGIRTALLGDTASSERIGLLQQVMAISTSSSSLSPSDQAAIVTSAKSAIQALEYLALSSGNDVNGSLTSAAQWSLAQLCHVSQNLGGQKAIESNKGEASSSKAMKMVSSYPALPIGALRHFCDLLSEVGKGKSTPMSNVLSIIRILSNCPVLPSGLDWVSKFREIWSFELSGALDIKRSILDLVITQVENGGSDLFSSLVDEIVQQILDEEEAQPLIILSQKLPQVLRCLSESRRGKVIQGLVGKVLRIYTAESSAGEKLLIIHELWLSLGSSFRSLMRPVNEAEMGALSMALSALPPLPPLLPGLISAFRVKLKQKEAVHGLLGNIGIQLLDIWLQAVLCIKITLSLQNKNESGFFFLDRLLPVHPDRSGDNDLIMMQMRILLSLCDSGVSYRDLVSSRSVLLQGRLSDQSGKSLIVLLPEALSSAGVANQAMVLHEAFDVLCHKGADSSNIRDVSLRFIASCVSSWSSQPLDANRDTPVLLHSMDRHLAASSEDALYILPYSLPKLLQHPLWSPSGPLLVEKLLAALPLFGSEADGKEMKQILVATLVELVQDDDSLEDKMKLMPDLM